MATSKNVIPAKARLGARLSAKPREAWAGIHKFLTLPDSHRSLPRTGFGAGVTNLGLLEIP